MSKYDKETKFYWLQLKEDFFEDDAISWLEEQQPNGRDYAYFYLKLCLKSLKSNGILIRNVGNILIPYDNKKLAELTKIDFDTVCIAMELLKKIGLIEILENGEIYITQLENLIGSKSMGALKKQQQRLIGRQKGDNCLPKIEIEIEKELEIEIDNKEGKLNSKNILPNDFKIQRFVKPTIDEIQKYCSERNNGINAEAFYDFYESKDWYVGKNKMKDWKACVRTWEKRNVSNNKSNYEKVNEEIQKLKERYKDE